MQRISFCSAIFCLAFLSCDAIIEVDNISNHDLSLYAPVDNAVITSGTINFSWDEIENADHYHLQIATPNFNNALQVISDTIVTVTNFSKHLESGQYQWRVRAENAEYQTNYIIRSISVED